MRRSNRLSCCLPHLKFKSPGRITGARSGPRWVILAMAAAALASCARSQAPPVPSHPSIVTVTGDNFESQVLGSDKPVLVDFWASWCGPCRMLEPTINALAAQYEGRVTIAKVDIDANSDLTDRLQISTIPTIMIYADGELISRERGVVPQDHLAATLDELLAKRQSPAPAAPEGDTAADPPAAGEAGGAGQDERSAIEIVPGANAAPVD